MPPLNLPASSSMPDERKDVPGHTMPPLLVQSWHIALRWRWLILGIILGTIVVGLIVSLLATPQYTATVRIEISREQKNVTNVAGLDSQDVGRDLEFYQTQYSLLHSRSLAERVVRKLRLTEDEGFFIASGARPSGLWLLDNQAGRSLDAAARKKREVLAVEVLLERISISPIRGSALIDISYTSSSPVLSALIANSWTNQFIAQSMDRRFASTADARKFLENRLSDLRLRLEKSERDLVNYARVKSIIALGKTQTTDGRTQVERTLASSDLEALNGALVEATAERIAAESKARGSNNGASSSALSNVTISQLRQKRAEIGSEYAKLMVQFEPSYPAARALAQQIAALDSSIAREEERVSTGRRAEYAEAMLRETDLRARVELLKNRINLQQSDSIQYNIYQREADTNRELYDGLLQRYKEIGVAGVGANNISIVDPATAPDNPSSPNLPLNLAAALLLGIIFAALTTLAITQIDEGLRDPSQVNRLLLVPFLGSVPDLGDEDGIGQIKDTKSLLTEAYLSIRSNLAFSTDHGMPRSFMVTSTRPSEGKSTSSLALAIVLARTGKNVLLLDADMRSPSQHSFLLQVNDSGLSNILAGENDWRKMVRKTSVNGVNLIVAGPTPPSAAELLSSDRMLMLVQQLTEHFDHVIIDSPPILGLADAPLLARTVEGCVFVTEAGGVAVRGIRSALGRLHSVHANVFGVILTKLKTQQAGYGYGYSYGYGYGATEVQEPVN